jgi:predicted amidophosphoribosyltransferase
MSLMTCPDCGREISSLAPACIQCGRPNNEALPAVAVALPECPLCGEAVTHPSARIGGSAWCERCGAKLVYGTDGALVRALPRTAAAAPAAQQVVIVGERKSVGAAILLALFFGPLGMLYSTGSGAVAMFFIMLVVGMVTLGMGVPFAWLACVAWAAHAATEHNRRLMYGVTVV